MLFIILYVNQANHFTIHLYCKCVCIHMAYVEHIILELLFSSLFVSFVPLILRSHDHSGMVWHSLEQFSTVMVFCVNEYCTIPNRTGPACLLLPCCMV